MIPTYGQEAFIARAVQSALDQDYEHFEVVVSDDGSPDGTKEAVRPFLRDPRVRYHRNETNFGRVGNYRKTLYERVSGDFAVNLDGDDYYIEPTFLSRAAACIAEDETLVLVQAGKRAAGSHRDGQLSVPEKDETITGTEAFFSKRCIGLAHMAAVYDRKKAMEIGFYTKDILSSDKESLLRLVLHGRVRLLPIIAGEWRLHGGNASQGKTGDMLLANLQAVLSPAEAAVVAGVDEKRIDAWRKAGVEHEIVGYIAAGGDDLEKITDHVKAHPELLSLLSRLVLTRLGPRALHALHVLKVKAGLQ